MSPATARQTEPVDPALVAEQLERILASSTFRAAKSQRAFLRHIVQEVLAGRQDGIKEYTIGVEALGRPASFDPRLDPIVRTQALKLRVNLAKYYESEGAADPVRIEFRKGSYLPLFTPAPVAILAEEPISPAAPAVVGRSSVRWFATAAVVLLLGSSGTFLRGTAAPSTVAVMPFANLSEKQEDVFLADGLTQDLLSSLGRVPSLRVVGRTSAFRYQGKNVDVREIGRELHAATILLGSVEHSLNGTVVSAQLLDTSTGRRVWAENYHRAAENVQDVGTEISRAVASSFAPDRYASALFGSSQPRSIGAPRPDAYQSYLRGLFLWNKLTPGALKMAIHYFEEAIDRDPAFARAYTALADSYAMAPMVSTAPSPEVVAKIRAAAGKALELDPTLGEAHIDLGICAEYDFDWDKAESEFRKGLELNPSNAVAHLWYARLLALRGRKSEVLEQRRIAAELDPVSPYAVQSLGGYYSVMGNYDEAIRYFHSALELEPGFGFARQGLGIAYLLQHRPGDAFRELKLAAELMEGPRRLALLGYAYGIAGRDREAREVLKQLTAASAKGSVPALAFAHVYLGLKEFDRAFEWMEKAVDEKDLGLTLQWDSHYDSIRSDPRYQSLLRRMKLA